MVLFNPWVAGVLMSAILAAVMSTLSCQLLVCASALAEDLYKPFLRKNASTAELVWVGRSMVLLVAFIAIALAMNPDSSVLNLVSYAWAGFGAAFGPVILISLLWARMTRNGALAGMLVGALTVMVWDYYDWFVLYEIVPAFILASLTIIIVSLLDKAPAPTILQRFQKAEAEYKTVEGEPIEESRPIETQPS
jgi:sodium/proline symporter